MAEGDTGFGVAVLGIPDAVIVTVDDGGEVLKVVDGTEAEVDKGGAFAGESTGSTLFSAPPPGGA